MNHQNNNLKYVKITGKGTHPYKQGLPSIMRLTVHPLSGFVLENLVLSISFLFEHTATVEVPSKSDYMIEERRMKYDNVCRKFDFKINSKIKNFSYDFSLGNLMPDIETVIYMTIEDTDKRFPFPLTICKSVNLSYNAEHKDNLSPDKIKTLNDQNESIYKITHRNMSPSDVIIENINRYKGNKRYEVAFCPRCTAKYDKEQITKMLKQHGRFICDICKFDYVEDDLFYNENIKLQKRPFFVSEYFYKDTSTYLKEYNGVLLDQYVHNILNVLNESVTNNHISF